MRLDKYLKVSRLIKRRQLAKDASNSERILLNGKIAKPSKEVNIGDVITIIFGKKIVEVKITKLIDSTKKDDALLMYELISEKKRQENNPVFKIRRIYMLILASKSPRRKEFLEKANLEFIIDTVETEEKFNNELSIEDALIDIARQKVMPVFKKHPTDTILGADTIVVCENQILGKPKNIEHEKSGLSPLSLFHDYNYGVRFIVYIQAFFVFVTQMVWLD